MAEEGSKLLTSIPPDMKDASAKIVRCFYGPECAVVFSYIQNERQVRDDALRPLLKLEMRDLRRIVNSMKVSACTAS
jgi:transcription initiation factor IIE alpha subunit